ncbi:MULTISPECIES: septum formation initiator family protein [unclassified Streptomyces]|uniref:FtsB family cell division protein n=1 Tax=unclassified Streptomyces TaxID=2593676 RepID=UPI003639BC4F
MSGPAKQLRGRAARLAQLMPSGNSSAARTPFVLLVVLLLGGGLITLLLLNSSLNEGSFQLSELKKRTTDLTDEEQALQRDVDERSAPYALERRARELGMVPGGSPAFLNPDGTVRGVPGAGASPSAQPSAQSAGRPSPMEETPPSAVSPPSPALSAPASPSPLASPSRSTDPARETPGQAPAPAFGTPAPTTPGR